MSVLQVKSIHAGNANSAGCFFFFFVFSCERRRFCKNRSFLLCFDVRFRILSNASSVVFFLFFFSSQLRLECLFSSAVSHSLPPRLLQCLSMSRLLQGNGRESLWLGRLITVYSLIRNCSVEQMVPWLITALGWFCHKAPNSSTFSPSEAIQMIIFIS